LGLGHTNSVDEVSCINKFQFKNKGEQIILAACGRKSSLVATNHGALYAFGSNSRSQLGIRSPDSTVHSQPVQIEHFSREIGWVQISSGAEHACALTNTGEVYTWGANDDGQCGQPRKYETVTTPRKLQLTYRVKAM
jgi:alpha-tubulin suppressor-like RCC1 family protein